jgi:hypothetical protein
MIPGVFDKSCRMLAVAGLMGVSFGRVVFTTIPRCGSKEGRESKKFFSETRYCVSMEVGGNVNSRRGESVSAKIKREEIIIVQIYRCKANPYLE